MVGLCATSGKVAGSFPDGIIGIIHYIILPAALWSLGVDSASNSNQYEDLSWRVKSACA